MTNEANLPIFVNRETILKNENARLITIQVKRDSEGIKLYLKSPVFEKFFSQYGAVESQIPWLGHTAYNMPAGLESASYQARALKYWGKNTLVPDGDLPNLAFLRMRGLSDGINVTVPTVMTRSQLLDFMRLFKDYTQTLYREFLKPVNQSLEIIISGDAQN